MVSGLWAWVDGVIGSADDLLVAPTDRGLLLAESVYDTCAVVDGQPYALTRHLRRLRRSAAIVGIDVPWRDAELREICAQLLAAASPDAGSVAGPGPSPVRRLRFTVTGGSGPLGVGPHDGPPSLVALLGPSRAWDPTTTVVTVPWQLDQDRPSVGAKVASVDSLLALAAVRRVGAEEAVMANRLGALCEGTGSNVFVVVDGVLTTPSLATGCLAGVTRELVLDVASTAGPAGGGVAERSDLTLEDLRSASEAFLTSATRNVHAISSVDGRNLGAYPGPVTRRVTAAFDAFRAENPDP